MIRYAFAAVLLTAVYALAMTSLHPWDLAAGLILSSALLLLARLRLGVGERHSPKPGRRELLSRVAAFFPFMVVVGGDVFAGAWRVILAVIGARPPRSPGVVGIPLGERTDRGVTVMAFLMAFSPGTLLILVDEDERVMWIHAMDAGDPDSLRREQQEFYDRYQRKVFP